MIFFTKKVFNILIQVVVRYISTQMKSLGVWSSTGVSRCRTLFCPIGCQMSRDDINMVVAN